MMMMIYDDDDGDRVVVVMMKKIMLITIRTIDEDDDNDGGGGNDGINDPLIKNEVPHIEQQLILQKASTWCCITIRRTLYFSECL